MVEEQKPVIFLKETKINIIKDNTTMVLNKLTKEVYSDRKHAKIALGTARYNKMVKYNELIFINLPKIDDVIF